MSKQSDLRTAARNLGRRGGRQSALRLTKEQRVQRARRAGLGNGKAARLRKEQEQVAAVEQQAGR